jgi:hypothetical protein
LAEFPPSLLLLYFSHRFSSLGLSAFLSASKKPRLVLQFGDPRIIVQRRLSFNLRHFSKKICGKLISRRSKWEKYADKVQGTYLILTFTQGELGWKFK